MSISVQELLAVEMVQVVLQRLRLVMVTMIAQMEMTKLSLALLNAGELNQVPYYIYKDMIFQWALCHDLNVLKGLCLKRPYL